MNGASQRCRRCVNPFSQCSHQWEAAGARSSRHAGKRFRILKDFTFHRFQRIHVVVDPWPQILHEAVVSASWAAFSVCPECWQRLSSAFRGADRSKHSLQCVTGGKKKHYLTIMCLWQNLKNEKVSVLPRRPFLCFFAERFFKMHFEHFFS